LSHGAPTAVDLYMTRTPLIVLVAAAMAALVVAGCGGGDNQATAASGQPGGSSDTISVADNGDLGKILVDSKGMTIYLFEQDSGPRSTCSGACAADWPPVTTTGTPSAGKGLPASMVGTTARSDGSKQVTYNGHPLYRYIGDQNAGDANGQNVNAFGALWYVLSPSGDRVTAKSSGAARSYMY
jgi:predicted lipoprotein with Yx(FWY)xxD motif